MVVKILKKLIRLYEKKIIFHRCNLNFPKIQTDLLIYSVMLARDLKLGHFGIFDVLFLFLAFFKL